jgi:Domain of unknown function (DUF929)
VALSRFGTLSGVGLTSSSSSDVFPDTPTLTFRGSSYASNYLDFVAVETADRQGAPLDKLSPDQQALMQWYDAPPYSATAGGIPFIDLGNRFVTSGAAYSPGLLQGMDQQQVVAALQNPSVGTGQSDPRLGERVHRCTLPDDRPAARARDSSSKFPPTDYVPKAGSNPNCIHKVIRSGMNQDSTIRPSE